MKKKGYSVYLPGYEYVPDGEPHVFGDRLYVFGSHDKFNGEKFCMNDYVGYSASVDDLTDWRYEGVIYRKTDDPDNADGANAFFAPDVAQGPDGRYYLYYGQADDKKIGVAVCDTPAGKYEFLGYVHDKNGVNYGARPQDYTPFDPGVLVDEDGRIHLYAGQAPLFKSMVKRGKKNMSHDSAYHTELEADMITMKTEPKRLIPSLVDSAETGFEGHEMFEANSIRKFDKKYYFIYSSNRCHELCWAVSDRPDGDFRFGGVLTSNGDISPDGGFKGGITSGTNPAIKNYVGNNHGSVVKVKDKYYIFGHRQTNRHMYSRQGYAMEIEFKDGVFAFAPLTSCGLNGGPFAGMGTFEARQACHLQSKKGACASNRFAQGRKHPYFTQDGVDREDNPNQHIANMRKGASCLLREFDFTQDQPKEISLEVRGSGKGVMKVYDGEGGKLLAQVPLKVKNPTDWTGFSADFAAPKEVKPLYFVYEGTGAIDFMSFTLA